MRNYHIKYYGNKFLLLLTARSDAEKLFICFIKARIVIITTVEINIARCHTGAQHQLRFDQTFKLNVLIYGRANLFVE